MSRNKIFLLLGVLWILILAGFVGYKEYTLRTGTEVLLKTMPVDPRDLFRGDYVVLRYEISNIDKKETPLSSIESFPAIFKSGDQVYVSLDVSGKYAVVSGISRSVPNSGLFISGSVVSDRGDSIQVEYGIESYFVPEGKGRYIESQMRDNVDVKVMIDKYGKALIKDVLINGEPVDWGSVERTPNSIF